MKAKNILSSPTGNDNIPLAPTQKTSTVYIPLLLLLAECVRVHLLPSVSKRVRLCFAVHMVHLLVCSGVCLGGEGRFSLANFTPVVLLFQRNNIMPSVACISAQASPRCWEERFVGKRSYPA